MRCDCFIWSRWGCSVRLALMSPISHACHLVHPLPYTRCQSAKHLYISCAHSSVEVVVVGSGFNILVLCSWSMFSCLPSYLPCQIILSAFAQLYSIFLIFSSCNVGGYGDVYMMPFVGYLVVTFFVYLLVSCIHVLTSLTQFFFIDVGTRAIVFKYFCKARAACSIFFHIHGVKAPKYLLVFANISCPSSVLTQHGLPR